MAGQKPYERHFYWLEKDEAEDVARDLRQRGVKVRMAKAVVCVALDPDNEVAVVAPEVWDGTCARQGGWYHSSDRGGKYLVVSALQLEDLGGREAGRILSTDFHPPRLATAEEVKSLAGDPAIGKRLPPGWSRVDEREKRLYLKWARRLGSRIVDYDLLHITHTANHANFLKPRFFVREGKNIVPYSLDRSAHLCSCCVELFGLLDTSYDPILVAPCPGAALFAELPPDQYLRVERTRTP